VRLLDENHDHVEKGEEPAATHKDARLSGGERPTENGKQYPYIHGIPGDAVEAAADDARRLLANEDSQRVRKEDRGSPSRNQEFFQAMQINERSRRDQRPTEKRVSTSPVRSRIDPPWN
jgi:hypothetical protein